MNKNKAKPTLTSPILIFGSGRCGSTLLSTMVKRHPSLLSISEFFAFTTDIGSYFAESFPPGKISAQDFIKIIASPWTKQNLLHKHNIAMKEMLYPFSSASRYSRTSGVPAFLQTTLPHLSEQHDALFQSVLDEISHWPDDEAATMYRRLFEFLTTKFNCDTWVERSGGSLLASEYLLNAFPDARCVHIVRDGREVALSMLEHPGFRFVILSSMFTQELGFDPFVSQQSVDSNDAKALPPHLQKLLPENFTGKAFTELPIPPEAMGQLWSHAINLGINSFQQLPENQLYTLRYEDLIASPKKEVEKLFAFMTPETVPDSQWFDEIVSGIRRPPARFPTLSPDAQARLNEACLPGFETLSEIGIEYQGKIL